MPAEPLFKPGLQDVVALETTISFLDTESERILIKGFDLIELSHEVGYVEMIHLLLNETLPDSTQTENVNQRLRDANGIPEEVWSILSLLPKATHPMDAQRTALSVLSGFDQDLNDRSVETNVHRAYQLLAQLPELTANSYHLLKGKQRIRSDKSLSYSANFLYLLTGKVPSKLEERIFDLSLLLYSEHELPNSTFAARVIASTLSDMYGALTGAVSSLKGQLHGGANEAVMNLLLEVGSPERFVELLREKLMNKEKIMGFGHRVYAKKMDPRALIMKRALMDLSEHQGDDRFLRMCEAGESFMEKEKGLYPNLDYYAAPVYYMLDIPIALYTPIFFCSRTAGLAAHVIEQHNHNRLFRPRVHYTGTPYSSI
ncbi:citrate synthase [Alkalicoccobacillus murimartini]|uniref:Citrate synthase n=1 Tax=Alkalicoccobacillus murimartini TaxID=171685 RepID=A0ABT9YDA5_9BACI|nr:citrate synthase [Alkalicoccobacillus murimartini]